MAHAEDRFWAKVDRSGDCWLWMAARDSRGYGSFCWNGRQGMAHRYAYEVTHGPIPDGMYICHNCPGGDNPRCVNPAHLYVGSHQDNTRDAVVKRQFAHGERHHRTTITAEDVRVIKESLLDPAVRSADLAERFGVKANVIRKIRRGETWGHVDITQHDPHP